MGVSLNEKRCKGNSLRLKGNRLRLKGNRLRLKKDGVKIYNNFGIYFGNTFLKGIIKGIIIK